MKIVSSFDVPEQYGTRPPSCLCPGQMSWSETTGEPRSPSSVSKTMPQLKLSSPRPLS